MNLLKKILIPSSFVLATMLVSCGNNKCEEAVKSTPWVSTLADMAVIKDLCDNKTKISFSMEGMLKEFAEKDDPNFKNCSEKDFLKAIRKTDEYKAEYKDKEAFVDGYPDGLPPMCQNFKQMSKSGRFN